ncbi:colorectal cancer associated 2, partial [Lepisosteus oculatus]|uniref:colorectal cancer associated 2 n=1 Tax=Lepisosteus oculatus TaxID=7918 RepID=UPI0037243781
NILVHFTDKPKVYQGVRVKTTVKELLQQRRALQAATKAATNHNAQYPEACSTSFPAPYFDYSPASSVAENNHFQFRQYTDNICYDQMIPSAYENQQLIDMILQSDNFTSNVLPPASSTQHAPSGTFHPGSDLYSLGMAPSSPCDSSNLPSPVDYSGYSPPQCYSSSSSCYSSPTRMDSVYSSIPEDHHYQHCSLQYCYCLSHFSGSYDNTRNPEYVPYPPSDCLYPSPVTEENYIRRDLASLDMCYL